MRTAIIVEGDTPVNAIVIPDGPDGDAMLSDTCIEVTGLDPQPGVNSGWTFVNGEFVPPPVTWDEVRWQRDRLLAESDWTQVADAPVDAEAWAAYRQALRDIPQTHDDPNSIVWPEAP